MTFPMPFIPPSRPTRNYFFLEGRADGNNLSTYTFSGITLYDPTSTRTIACFVGARNVSSTVTSVTIGGVTATLYRNVSASGAGCLAVAEVPVGSSVDIVVVYGAGAAGSGMVAWQMNGLDSPVPVSTDRAYAASGVLSVTLPSFTVPANGFGLFGAYSGRAGTPAWTFTGLFEEYDVGVGGGDGRIGGGSDNRLTLGSAGTQDRIAANSFTDDSKLLIGAAFK